MSIEITVMKTPNGTLAPVSSFDVEAISKLKPAQGYRVTVTQLSERALKHHRLFFAGLLELALEYWEPGGGLIQPSERNILKMFCKRLEANTGNEGKIWAYGKQFLQSLQRKRAGQFQPHSKRKEDLLYWLKMEVGHVDKIQTPTGVILRPKSINFNSMPQEEFDVFYKQCYNVCWNMILNKVFNGDQDECDRVINQLLSMG